MSLDKRECERPAAGSILPAGPDAVTLAGATLRAGGLVGMPTETVYGLAADASNAAAVARIFESKGRPRFNPLISHVASLEEARRHGVFDLIAERLAAAFWPGPLTLVLPLAAGSTVCDLARAGLDTVALRVPGHPTARAIIEAAGAPVAAPSANRSGRISPTTARAVAEELGASVDLIVDAGACAVGLESTVAACVEGRLTLLRPGGVPRDELARAAGVAPDQPASEPGPLLSPGMLLTHYAPLAPLHMNVMRPDSDHAVLAFGVSEFSEEAHRGPVINLSRGGDLREAAMRLFSALRELDSAHPAAISVTPIPDAGLGEAINDRLRRASFPQKSGHVL
jgi:L-threonylcarbamoyladenylate synthase